MVALHPVLVGVDAVHPLHPLHPVLVPPFIRYFKIDSKDFPMIFFYNHSSGHKVHFCQSTSQG
jgi:hypothetical protein